jgi:predicted permease
LDGFIDTVEPGEQIEEIGATPEPGGETTSVVVKETQSTKEKLVTWLKLSRRGDIWRSILAKIICNPVIWGIVGGFILSLSTVGPTYLKPEPPPNENYVPGLGWIWSTTLWLGSCVSPVSLFTMGVWMQDQGRKLFLIPPLSVVLYMLAKLVVVPLIMMGLALAVNLDDNSGRAAVLIAALPISMASFTLGNRYKVGEAILAENIFMGTALLLPTILLWNLILDKVGLFPITKTGA